MKKTIVLLVGIFCSQIVFAVNPKILSQTRRHYASAGIDFYSQAEDALVILATQYCGQYYEQVDKISNINIQVIADFELNVKSEEPIKTSATTSPQVHISGLVSCKVGTL